MGKGKVSEQEVWMMKGMYWDGMSIKDISSELSRSTTTIEKYLDLKDDPESEEKPNKNNTTMFVRSSAAKNNNSVTIMTDAESSRSDAVRGQQQSATVNKLRNNIHKISDNDGEAEN